MQDLPILALSRPKASAVSGLGETALKQLERDGILETVVIGKRRLILFASLQRLLQSARGKPGDARRNPAALNEGFRRYRDAVAAARAPAADAAPPPARRRRRARGCWCAARRETWSTRPSNPPNKKLARAGGQARRRAKGRFATTKQLNPEKGEPHCLYTHRHRIHQSPSPPPAIGDSARRF
jgi:hypothetical protein